MNRAGAALRYAAAILGAGETNLLANDPEQRRVGLHLDVARSAIDIELRHRASSRSIERVLIGDLGSQPAPRPCQNIAQAAMPCLRQFASSLKCDCRRPVT